MFEMDFEKEMFEIIWSEEALYFLGFAKRLKTCYQLLKPIGYFVVTEAVYLKPDYLNLLLSFGRITRR